MCNPVPLAQDGSEHEPECGSLLSMGSDELEQVSRPRTQPYSKCCISLKLYSLYFSFIHVFIEFTI